MSIPPVMRTNDRQAKVFNLLAKMAVDVSPVANARLAACMVYKNEIISFGTNRKKSHPFQAKYGKNGDAIYLHAETLSIFNALRRTTPAEMVKCVLYVCRVKYTHAGGEFTFGLSCPCQGCRRAIVNFGINRCYYSLEGHGYDRL